MEKSFKFFIKYFCTGLLILFLHELVVDYLFLLIVFYILIFIALSNIAIHEKSRKYKLRIFISAILICLGLPFFDYCGNNHICSGGHMAHPPYKTWDYVNDVLYTSLLLAGGMFLYKIKNRFCTFTAILVHISLFFRILRAV